MVVVEVSLQDLPSEIVHQILRHVSPEDACAVGLANKRLHAVASAPFLWAFYYNREYTYGRPLGSTQEGSGTLDNAQQAFADRRRLDRDVLRLFDGIVSSTQHRNKRIEEIASHGMDVKQVMLGLTSDKENLSQTFWANAILGRIHRSLAVAAWKTKESLFGMTKLAEMLAAFDMFVIDGEYDKDFQAIGTELKRLAVLLKDEHPQLMKAHLQPRAVAVKEFLRSRGFLGVQEEDDYHNLQNNFIGHALFHEKHEALPLICTAIYCALAQEVGLEANPCSFPYHVYATITGGKREIPGPGIPTSDNVLQIEEHLETPIYIDAFRPGIDVPRSHLERLLVEMSAAQSSYQLFLGPASPIDMVVRTGHNIVRSIQTIHGRPRDDTSPPPWVSVSPDLDMAYYATLYSSIVLGTHAHEGDAVHITTRRRRCIPYLVEHFKNHCPWDAELIRHDILPLFLRLPGYDNLDEVIRRTMAEDANHPPVTRRGARDRANVKYYIGQVFRHKRFGYLAVIKGWNVNCQAGEAWIRQMNVDSLPGGRNQPFYQVLVEDKGDRYVAAENIEITNEYPSQALLKIAGRYFHRYDEQARRFISNIKEEYPDD